jgi:hypothetical protein
VRAVFPAVVAAAIAPEPAGDILARELNNESLLPKPPELVDEVHVETASPRAFAGLPAFSHNPAKPGST